ncbi:hypothetical protein SO694_00012037 [Aureococcus anophagefferens]|uniref:Uncharacterized protein n=1 Tax=Aureococcus anophagefferens TaxID=44056 RepID=A0ABR1G1Y2_AURAN
MGASQSEECEIPWFVQCDGHYIAREGSKSPHGWLRLEGHGSASAAVRAAGRDDARDLEVQVREFCLFDAMTGEGLKHVELGGLRAVTVDGSEELILLLSGLEDVSPGDDASVTEIKAETDKFVATLSKPLYGAALEKLRGRIDFDAVSSAAFAAEVAANATSNDETFAQSAGLFEVWTALNVATLRTAQRAELVRDVAGYFFNAVTASPASELVLDKLKNFNLVPDDETDPEKLRDAFVDRAATAFAGAVAVFNVLAGLLSFALLYGVFSLVIEPLFGFLGDAASGALDPAAPRDTITDFFAQRP